MRLLIATPLYPPEAGGPATYAKLLAEGLPSLGIQVTVVRFSYVRRYPKLCRHFAYLLRILREGRRADMILVLDPVSTGFPAAVAAVLLKKPLVLKVVGDYAWEQGRQRFGVTASLDDFVQARRVPLPVALLRSVETWVADRAALIIVPSEYLKKIVCAWGIQGAKVRVVPNAVAPTMGGVVPQGVHALRGMKVLTVARLVPWKGIDGLIEAVAEARSSAGDFALIVVGDGPERSRLEKLAHEALDSNYLFTGPLPPPDTQATMHAAHAFVLNSTYEGLSHVLIEALLHGLPTIATRAGGNPEVLGEEGGTLLSVGDTHALSRELIALAKDERLRKARCVRARRQAEHFTVPVMLMRTKEVLSQAL